MQASVVELLLLCFVLLVCLFVDECVSELSGLELEGGGGRRVLWDMSWSDLDSDWRDW